jgi:L-threonylcarbamoyladenylate synthase
MIPTETPPRRVPLDPITDEALGLAADALRAGELIAFPTETVYGLGANALDPVAVAKIYAAKGRPPTNPLIVHVADEAAAQAVVAAWPDDARKLAAKFWPGPLTLVLPRHEGIPDAVTAGGPTVAVRCPAHPGARAILAAAGVPVAAPSANRSGELSPTTADHVLKGMGGRVRWVFDGGPCPGGVESTVLALSGFRPRLLRPGPVTVAEIEAVVGPIDATAPKLTADAPMPGPGMLPKHYAPRTPLECAETEDEWNFLVNLYETAGLKVGRARFDGDPARVMATLYAELHALDDAGHDRLIALLPQPTDTNRAVRDRLARAALD